MALPDDDDDIPRRRRPAMDEVADSHATLGIAPISAPLSTNVAAATPPAPVVTSTAGATGFGGGFAAPSASGFGGGFGASGATGAGFVSPPFNPGGFSSAASPGGLGSTPSTTQPGTGSAMQEGGVAAIQTDTGFSDFINKRWRPLMAVIYMVTCTTDFVIFPILWSILQASYHGTVTSQWAPLTLQGAGLYHIAMGAVLGLAAYGRSQEKIAGKA